MIVYRQIRQKGECFMTLEEYVKVLEQRQKVTQKYVRLMKSSKSKDSILETINYIMLEQLETIIRELREVVKEE